mmetsp:Transcript_20375/g.81467  ORF Transcript_20375/g.81467 Transcript_20375/m.81467 type:complete len:385 (+) Transcript_20375:601-1755(+)
MRRAGARQSRRAVVLGIADGCARAESHGPRRVVAGRDARRHGGRLGSARGGPGGELGGHGPGERGAAGRLGRVRQRGPDAAYRGSVLHGPRPGRTRAAATQVSQTRRRQGLARRPRRRVWRRLREDERRRLFAEEDDARHVIGFRVPRGDQGQDRKALRAAQGAAGQGATRARHSRGQEEARRQTGPETQGQTAHDRDALARQQAGLRSRLWHRVRRRLDGRRLWLTWQGRRVSASAAAEGVEIQDAVGRRRAAPSPAQEAQDDPDVLRRDERAVFVARLHPRPGHRARRPDGGPGQGRRGQRQVVQPDLGLPVGAPVLDRRAQRRGRTHRLNRVWGPAVHGAQSADDVYSRWWWCCVRSVRTNPSPSCLSSSHQMVGRSPLCL